MTVQEFPDDAEVQLLYATILLEFRPDDVGSEVTKAVELAPDDPIILVRAGSILLGRGRRDTARSCFARARELVAPDFLLMSGLLNGEGVLAMLDEDYEFAEIKLRAAVESDPTSGPFASDLVRLLAVLGRREEALEVADQALARADQKHDLEGLRRKLASAEI